MQTRAPYPADTGSADTSATVELNVVLAYESLSAALWAGEILAALSRKDSDQPMVRLLPWSFSTLENPALRRLAAADADQADLIVIASRGVASTLSAGFEDWLKTCLTRPRRTARLAVAALFEPDVRLAGADSPRLQAVRRLTQAAGCTFFAPRAAEEFALVV